MTVAPKTIRSIVAEFIGKQCWSVVAGKGTGSVIALDFGRKIERCRRLKNPYLNNIQQKYTGAYGLYVSCSWRLESKKRILCNWSDVNTCEDATTLLHCMEKCRVTDATITKPSFDLAVELDGAWIFRVFCDLSVNDDDDNYSLFTPSRIYTVTSRYPNIVEEERVMGRIAPGCIVKSSESGEAQKLRLGQKVRKPM